MMNTQEIDDLVSCSFSKDYAWSYLKRNQIPKFIESISHQSRSLSNPQQQPLSAGVYQRRLGLLRHISRIHGLSQSMLETVVELLQSPNHPVQTQRILVQTIKHSFTHSIPPEKLWTPLLSFTRNVFQKNSRDTRLLSDLVITLCAFRHSCPNGFKELKFLRLQDLNREAQGVLLDTFQTCGISFTPCGDASGDQSASGGNNSNGDISNNGRRRRLHKVSQFFKLPSSSKTSSNRPHSVKVQQVFTDRTTEAESEAVALTALNLSRALSTRVSSSSPAVEVQKKAALEVEPEAAEIKSTSDTIWYRNTNQEVTNLKSLATEGKLICTDDQTYLIDKLLNTQVTLEQRSTINAMIAETFFHISKRQRIKLTHCSSILDLLDSLPCKSYEVFSLWSVKMFENCLARDPSYFTQQCRDVLGRLLTKEDWSRNVKKIIYDILIWQDNDPETYTPLFVASLNDATSGLCFSEEETLQKLEYVRIQSLNKQRSERLFDRRNVSKLVRILRVESNPLAVRKIAAQCIENYVEHGITPSNLQMEDVEAFVQGLDKILDVSLQLGVARVILKYLVIQKESLLGAFDIPESIWISIVKFILSTQDLRVKGTVLAALESLSKSFFIHDAQKLSCTLLGNESVAQKDLRLYDSDIKEEQTNNDSTADADNKVFLSQIVSKIFLNTNDVLKTANRHFNPEFRMSQHNLNNILQAIGVSTDKQTRIMCAEYLQVATSFNVPLPEGFLMRLAEHLNDPVTDVRTYCTWAFTKAAKDLAHRDMSVHLDSQLFEKVLELFLHKKVVFKKLPSFTDDINFHVMSVLSTEIRKPNSVIPDCAFSLLESLLEADADSERKAVNILLGFCLTHKEDKLPESIVEVIEPLYLSTLNPNRTATLSIFEKLVSRGQAVPNGVVQCLADELTEQGDHEAYTRLFNTFIAANLNQEFPFQMFTRVQMELWNKMFHIIVSKSPSIPSDLTDDQFWKFLEKLLEKDSRLSQESLNIFEEILGEEQEIQDEQPSQRGNVLRCLLLAAKNGQNIPDPIVASLAASSNATWEHSHAMLLRFYMEILSNHQSLPEDVRQSLETRIEAGGPHTKQIIPVVLLDLKTRCVYSDQTVQTLCKAYKADLTDEGLLQGLINVSRRSSQLTVVTVASLSRCFFKALTMDGLEGHAIEGIANLSTLKTFGLINSEIDSILKYLTKDGLGSRQSESVVTLIRHLETKNLTPSQRKLTEFFRLSEIEDDVAFLNNLEAFAADFRQRQGVGIKWNSLVIRRLLGIAARDLNERNLVKVYSLIDKEAMKQLEAFDLKELMESAASSLATSTDDILLRSTQDFLRDAMDLWITFDIPFSRKLLRTLESNLDSTGFLLHSEFNKDPLQFSLETQLEMNLRKLESSTNEETEAQTLCNISSLLSKGVPLSSASVSRITSCKSKSSKSFTEVLAKLIVFSDVQADENIAEVLFQQLQNSNQVEGFVYDAMDKALKSHTNLFIFETKLETFEKNLIKHFNAAKSTELKVKVLQVIQSFCALRPSHLLYIILEQNLTHADPRIRMVAYKAMEVLSNDGVLVRTFQELQSRLEGQMISVLGKNFEWTGDSKKKVLETLISLETLDWSIFKRNQNNQTLWRQELILSNILARFVINPLDKLKFLETTRRLLETLDDPHLARRSLEVATNLFRSGADVQKVSNFVKSLTVIALHDRRKLEESLNNSQEHLSSSQTEQTALELLLLRKSKLTSHMTKCLVNDSLQKIGYNLTKQIVDSLEDLHSFDVFEEIVSVAEDLRKDAQLNLPQDSLTSTDLKKSVQKLALATLLWNCKLSKLNKRLNRTFLELSDKSTLTYEFLKRLTTLRLHPTFQNKKSKELEVVLEILLNYPIEQPKAIKILESLEASEEGGESWVTIANEILLSSTKSPTSTLKSPAEVVQEFKSNLPEDTSNFCGIPISQLETNLTQINSGNFLSSFKALKSLGLISSWTEKNIKKWAEVFRFRSANGFRRMSIEVSIECLAVAKRAYLLSSGFHLTSVQSLSLLLALNKRLQGQLQQVSTGSGKSTIVAVLAALTAIRLDGPVDVFTSSRVLAERDAKTWTKFYGFFGLTCSHNGDTGRPGSYVGGRKECYTANVVYGETSMFQFDFLRHHYSNLGTLGQRTNVFAIVDEVDSLLVDDTSKLARLSSPLPGMDLIQFLYNATWHRISFLESKLFSIGPQNLFYVHGKVSFNGSKGQASLEFISNAATGETTRIPDLVDFILRGENLAAAGIIRIENLNQFVSNYLTAFLKSLTDVNGNTNEGFDIPEASRVRIPYHLRRWVTFQIPRWVDSSITAKAYQETVHYIIEHGQVKPVDWDKSGLVQSSTSWSDGLHQFLQLKHGLRMTSESLTTNFLSNLAIFQKYSNCFKVIEGEGSSVLVPCEPLSDISHRLSFKTTNLVGFTGTLGPSHSRNLLQNLYNVTCVDLPEVHRRQFVQYVDKTVRTRDLWLQELVHGIHSEILRRRGVLVICETIKDALELRDQLNTSLPAVRPILYTRNNAGQEEAIERIQPGGVIIATNLAGRGTDIITDEIEAFGGLHVILSFMTNVRVAKQAIGRTSRQGRLGSGQLICICEPNISIEELQTLQDSQEEFLLKDFVSNELPLLRAKDACFQRFCAFLTSARSHLRTQINENSKWSKFKDLVTSTLSRTGFSPPSPFEQNVLQAIEERWSLFLAMHLEGKTIPLRHFQFFYNLFERGLLRSLQKGPKQVIRSPFYFISIGYDFLQRDSKLTSHVASAMEFFNDAIKLSSDFDTGAHVGKGFCYLKGSRNLIFNDTHEANCRTKAIASFSTALLQLQDESAQISTSLSLLQNSLQPPESFDDLAEQLSLKLNALSIYCNGVNEALQVAQSSLRGVNITANCSTTEIKSQRFVPHLSKSFEYTDDTVQSTRNVLNHLANQYDTFSLELKDLTVSEDIRTKDQVTLTIDRCKHLCTSVEIKYHGPCTSADLLLLLNPHKQAHNLKKKEALKTLKKWRASLSIKRQLTDKIIKYFRRKNVDVEVLGNEGDPVRPRRHEGITLDDAITEVETWRETDAFNLRMNSGNSEVYATMKDACLNVQMVSVISSAALQTLAVLSDSPVKVTLNIPTSKIQSFLSQLTNLGLETSQVTLVHSNETEWISSTVDLLNPNHQLNLQAEEVVLKEMEINEAQKVLRSCPESQPISITIHNWDQIDNARSTNLLINNQELFSKLKLTFCSIQSSKYSAIVSCLRKTLDKFDFTLVLHGLSKEAALKVIAEISHEPIEESKKTTLASSFPLESRPTSELFELQLRGLHIICEFNEKSPVPWASISCVTAFALVELSLGGILIFTPLGQTVGAGLLFEAVGDILSTYRTFNNRNFSWQWYGLQKAASLAMAIYFVGPKAVGIIQEYRSGVSLVAKNVGRETGERLLTSAVMKQGNKFFCTEAGKENLKTVAAQMLQRQVNGLIPFPQAIALKVSLHLAMHNMKPGVCLILRRRVTKHFTECEDPEFLKHLRLFWALDVLTNSNSLSFKLQSVVKKAFKSEEILTLIESLGIPKYKELLNGYNTVNDGVNFGMQVSAAISGSREVTSILNHLTQRIYFELRDEPTSHIKQIMIKHLEVSPLNAERMQVDVNNRNHAGLFDFFHFEVISHEITRVSEFFAQLNLKQTEFTLEKVDATVKWISEILADYILKEPDSRCNKPLGHSSLNDQFLSRVSSLVESDCAVNDDESPEDSRRNMETQSHRQIMERQFHEISEALEDSQETRIHKDVAQKIRDILSGASAGFYEMLTLATIHGKQLLIFEEDEVIHPADNYSPDQIILIHIPLDNQHYFALVDSSTGSLVPVQNRRSRNDSGYSIFAHLIPETTPEEFRLQLAVFIKTNAEECRSLIQNEKWMEERKSQDATEFFGSCKSFRQQ